MQAVAPNANARWWNSKDTKEGNIFLSAQIEAFHSPTAAEGLQRGLRAKETLTFGAGETQRVVMLGSGHVTTQTSKKHASDTKYYHFQLGLVQRGAGSIRDMYVLSARTSRHVFRAIIR